MTLIEHARRPDVMSKHALTLCLGKYSSNVKCNGLFHKMSEILIHFNADNLMKDFKLNTIVGAMGLLRVLLPKILSTTSLELCVVHKVIEIYEICLHLLGDTNHTIINASLECLCVILNNSKPQLSNLLINDKLIHMEVLCRKRSLKNQIFRRKLSTSSLETSKNQFTSPGAAGAMESKKSPSDGHSTMPKDVESESDVSNVLDYVTSHNASCDDKGLLTGSDIEMDSLRLNDFELCQSNESLVQLSEASSPITKKSAKDSHTLKNQKSTDSIGSFLNTLIHPNTGEHSFPNYVLVV